jgi:hypothetical protein
MFYFAQVVLVIYGLLYAYFYFYGSDGANPENPIKLDIKGDTEL